MSRITWFAMVAATLFAGAQDAAAQGFFPLAVEVRGGAGFPVGDLGEGDAIGTGWGFEGNAQLRVAPLISVYGGYDIISFDLDDEGIASDATFRDQGFSAGAQLSLPTGMLLGVSPFVRAGALFHQAEYDFGDEAGDFESDRSLGYEVGGGLVFPLGLVVSFTPAVRYRSYGLEFEGNQQSDENVSYINVDLGLKFSF